MKADTMPANSPTALRIVLDIGNLGAIPQHQETPKLTPNIEAYFNDGICDEPLQNQLKHFGIETIAHMLKNELTSWLQHLDAEPTVVSITPLRAQNIGTRLASSLFPTYHSQKP